MIHEQAIHDLGFIKEVFPNFYDKLYHRVTNVNTSVQSFQMLANYVMRDLPPYFGSWQEYVDYLADNICEDKANAEKIKHGFRMSVQRMVGRFGHWQEGVDYITGLIGYTSAICVLAEDFEMKRIQSIERTIHAYYNDHYKDIVKANKEYEQSRGIN